MRHLAGVEEIVPAARTVLVRLSDGPIDLPLLRDALMTTPPAPDRSVAETVEVPTRYDGPDLETVATQTGLSPGEVVRRHRAPLYTVAFIGFAPGFAYLTGGDPALRVSRRATPRPSVPAGSVALADSYTGVYPRSSPGGWQLLGRTELMLFDTAADPPSPFAPGVRVRFVEKLRR